MQREREKKKQIEKKLDFFILHTNKKSPRKFVPCSYVQYICERKEQKQQNKQRCCVVQGLQFVVFITREKVMLAETVGKFAS